MIPSESGSDAEDPESVNRMVLIPHRIAQLGHFHQQAIIGIAIQFGGHQETATKKEGA